MTDTIPGEKPQTLAELEAAIARIVADISDSSDDGVFVTKIGSAIARLLETPFEMYVNHIALNGLVDLPASQRKLMPFIRMHCQSTMEVFDDERGRGKRVRLLGASKVDPQSGASTEPALTYKFRRSLWSAFIKPLSTGYTRYYCKKPPYTFTDFPEDQQPSSDDWVEIQKEFILALKPTEVLDPTDAESRIREWSLKNGHDITEYVETDRSGSAGTRGGGALGNFISVIEKLPSDITDNWSIPASVLLALSKQ